MVMQTESPVREPRGLSRLEVWLFVAVSLVGLLGFMATLSTGDVEGTAGSEEPRPAVSASQDPEAAK